MDEMTDEQVAALRERLRNKPGELLLDDFWGQRWPVGRGAELSEEIKRRIMAYDRMVADIKRWLEPML